MLMKASKGKLKLYGFNNLTKSLSFNIYDICYTKSDEDRKKYIEYIDEQYNSTRLTKILSDVTEMIGASGKCGGICRDHGELCEIGCRSVQ